MPTPNPPQPAGLRAGRESLSHRPGSRHGHQARPSPHGTHGGSPVLAGVQVWLLPSGQFAV